jgi:NADH-quinone oxidoreductase subunit N
MTSGVVNGSTQWGTNAYSAAMFYVVTYVLTTLGTFGMVILLSRQGHEAEEIKDLAGLAKRSPWFALVMTMFMVSLAGLPPTVGFYAKLAVLQALVVTGLPFYIGLSVFAVVLSLIGAFYYLRVVKVMWFDAPTDTAPLAAPGDVRFVMTLNGAAVLVFGLLPGGLLELCKVAIRQALAT